MALPKYTASGPRSKVAATRWTHLFWLYVGAAVSVAGVWLSVNLPPTNWTRIVGILLPPGVAVLLGIVLGRRRWAVYLVWLCLAAGLSALAWWFVPTTQGLTFWDATRRLAQLEEVATNDRTAFLSRHAACVEVADQFPYLAKTVEAIRERWAADTVKAALAEAQSQLPGDPAGASRQLRQLQDDLLRVGYFSDQQGGANPSLGVARDRAALRQARRQVLDCRVAAAAEELAALEKERQYAAIDALRERLEAEWGQEARAIGTDNRFYELQDRCAVLTLRAALGKVEEDLRAGNLDQAVARLKDVLRERAVLLSFTGTKDLVTDVRRRLVRARLEAARKELVALVDADKFADVARLKERLDADWKAEAAAAAATAELQAFLGQCEFLLQVAASAGKLPEPPPVGKAQP
jgi:hypothetical protein